MFEKEKKFLKLLGVELEQEFQLGCMSKCVKYKITYDEGELNLMSRDNRNEYEEDCWDYSSLEWTFLLRTEIIPIKQKGKR